MRQLVWREVAGRYRGATLGMVWSLLNPLLMLASYTFVFSTVLKAKWAPPSAPVPSPGAGPAAAVVPAAGSNTEFAIILFIGLIIFGIFAEVINRAPSLVLSNGHYVKRIVFPLETFVPVAMGTALFHAAISLVVLFAFMLFEHGGLPLTALWLPIILAPFVLLTMGLGWLFASLGVYLRDISQLMPSIMNMLMFMSPIFIPSSSLPDWIRPWLYLNPVTVPVEQARNVLFWHQAPDVTMLLLYTAAAIVIAVFGFEWFDKTRKGFADVI